MTRKEWKLPLTFALGIHVAIIMGGIYAPSIFKAKPKFAEIYEVSVINVAEPDTAPEPQQEDLQQSQAPEPQKQEPAPASIKKIPTRKVVPVVEKKRTEVAPVPTKALSLKPLKRKRKKVLKHKVQPAKPGKDNAKQQRRLLAQQIREQALLEEKARLANEALEREKTLLRQSERTITTRKPTSNRTNSTGRANQNSGSSTLIQNQYYAAVINRLHAYWAVPESLLRKTNLLAVVVITVRKNGEIADMFFESRSGDRVFDQFVQKTLKAAAPLPPIPPALKKQRLELGLRFKPGSIQ